MSKRVLGAVAMTALAVGGWAIWAMAFDHDKQTSAQASGSHDAKVTAVVAGQGAGTSGCSSSAAAACKANGNASMTSTASTAGMPECCAGKMKGATASMGQDGCAASLGAGMIGAPSCPHSGASATAAEMKSECDACAEMVTCSNDLSANDVQTQIVPLRNGVMFVYTADTPAHVRAVQNAVARRGDRLTALAQAGDRAKLCGECRSARGAMASGKLTRETVNIEGGCMTLVTSSEPALVSRLRAMAATSNGRNKS